MASTVGLDSCLDAIERRTSEEALAQVLAYIGTEGCSVNDIGSFGYTILVRACEKNHLEVIDLCFQHQINYNHQTTHKETAFNSASRHGSVAVLCLLVQLSSSVISASENESKLSPLDIRSRNSTGCTPFHQAVQSGDLEKVRYMANELDVDLEESDDSDVTPLHSAVKRGDIRMVEYLHALGCNVHTASTSGASPIFSAVSHKMYKKGVTYQHNLELTKLLLSYGASPTIRTNRGWTLLSGAVDREDIQLAKFLLSLPGCDVNEPADGKTPLFRAVEKGNLPLVQLLVRHGADVNLQNTAQHLSPLLKACDKIDTKMAQYLVHVGAEMPLQLGRIRNVALRGKLQLLAENRKYFPIHTFLRRNDENIIRLLETIRLFGGDICRTDGNGQTPYMIVGEMYRSNNSEESDELRSKVLLEILIHVCRVVVQSSKSSRQSQIANSIFVKPSSTRTFPSFRYFSNRELIFSHKDKTSTDNDDDADTDAEVMYFEVMVLTEGLVQIGVTAAGWTPASSSDGVGDDNRSVAFDGYRKCCFVCGKQVALETEVLDTMPVWGPDAIVGVAVSVMKGQRGVTFFLNNVRMTAAISLEPIFLNIDHDSESDVVDEDDEHKEGASITEENRDGDIKKRLIACSAACTLSRGSAVRCNFGERAFAFAPNVDIAGSSSGEVTPWNAGVTRKRRNVMECYQVASENTATWIEVDHYKTDEFAVESSQDLFDFVAKDSNSDLLDSVLSSVATSTPLEHAEADLKAKAEADAVDMNILCNHIKDPFARTLMDLASASCRKVLQSYLFFLKRYEFLTPNRPEHISDTCVIMLCRDHHTGEGEDHDNDDDGDGEDEGGARARADAKKIVALKIMKNKKEYQKEVSSRVNSTLSDTYVVGILDHFDGEADVGIATELQEKGFGNYKFCIVMQAAERSLERILVQENIAGKEWSQIKYMFTQIVNCVRHIHTQHLLHADLKPLNIMRTGLGNMILIDLDSSVDMRGGASTGAGGGGILSMDQKFSSAFCPPEWAAAMLQLQLHHHQHTTASLAHTTAATAATACAGSSSSSSSSSSNSINNNANNKAPFLVAQGCFDLWALGAILFHMTAGEPLFLSNQADCIDTVNLNILSEWSDAHKESKLLKILDPQARNLVSRLLNKDAARRASLSAVLLHPFLSGRPATRLVGQPADFDVFISYRVASDSNHAEMLYDRLTTLGLRVWFDKKCLLPGKNWEEGFCDGLVSSRAFVCLLSQGAIAHPTNTRQNLSQLSVTSGCDNVLLEHQLALEMRAMGMLEYVFPVFIGEEEPVASNLLASASAGGGGGMTPPICHHHYQSFDFSVLDNMPTFSIPSVDKKVRGHLDRQCLGAPLCPSRPVQDTLSLVSSCQGGFISGEGQKAFDAVATSVYDMCQLSSSSSSPLSSPPPPPPVQPQQLPPPLPPLSQQQQQGVMTRHIRELQLQMQDMLVQNKSAAEIDAFACDFIKNLNIV